NGGAHPPALLRAARARLPSLLDAKKIPQLFPVIPFARHRPRMKERFAQIIFRTTKASSASKRLLDRIPATVQPLLILPRLKCLAVCVLQDVLKCGRVGARADLNF